MSLSAIPKAQRARVFGRDRGQCRYCGLSQFGQGSLFHINHVIPRSKGGRTEDLNLALQCPSCSLHKADKLTAADPATGEILPIFHPLQQNWAEHFELRSDGTIVGTSPTGRATVRALHMNDALPRTARALQIILRLLVSNAP